MEEVDVACSRTACRKRSSANFAREALARHSEALTARRRDLLSRRDVGADVESVHVEVFADEGGDGFVNAAVSFEGGNRKVSGTDPTLFSGRHVAITDGMRVLLCDPDSYDFDVRDAAVAEVLAGSGNAGRTPGERNTSCRRRSPATTTLEAPGRPL